MFACQLTKLRRLGLIAAFITSLPFAAWGQSRVALAWDASRGGAIAGYRLYSGVANQSYSTMEDVGNATTATVSNLVAGMTYYFAVTAYDPAGLESAFSAEVGYTVPSTPAAPVSLQLSFTETGEVLLTGSAPPGYVYDVQVSSDLSSWTSVGSVVTDTSALLEFTDPNVPAIRARYYRLHQISP
ncbi:MAG TPA: fibronectin type III domain-containing protein [Candidatus Acidoferrum sp.]|jgi:hypothetical protein|nr:fibronectin type III domain-containing protein [Candidatus Acidoferrum sp.]